MKNFNNLKKQLLSQPKIKQEYQALEFEYNLIIQLIQKRLEKKLTQKQLASKIGTKQSAISRLESGSYNPSFAFLKKIAHALDVKLQISLT